MEKKTWEKKLKKELKKKLRKLRNIWEKIEKEKKILRHVFWENGEKNIRKNWEKLWKSWEKVEKKLRKKSWEKVEKNWEKVEKKWEKVEESWKKKLRKVEKRWEKVEKRLRKNWEKLRKSWETKATELQSYKATDTIFLEDLFSSEEKATELQRYRATGTYFFFGGKKSYRDTKKVTKLCNFVTFEKISKLQRNEDTELQSYRHNFFGGFIFIRRKSYRATKIQSYRHLFFLAEKKLQRYKKSYKAM